MREDEPKRDFVPEIEDEPKHRKKWKLPAAVAAAVVILTHPILAITNET